MSTLCGIEINKQNVSASGAFFNCYTGCSVYWFICHIKCSSILRSWLNYCLCNPVQIAPVTIVNMFDALYTLHCVQSWSCMYTYVRTCACARTHTHTSTFRHAITSELIVDMRSQHALITGGLLPWRWSGRGFWSSTDQQEHTWAREGTARKQTSILEWGREKNYPA